MHTKLAPVLCSHQVYYPQLKCARWYVRIPSVSSRARFVLLTPCTEYRCRNFHDQPNSPTRTYLCAVQKLSLHVAQSICTNPFFLPFLLGVKRKAEFGVRCDEVCCIAPSTIKRTVCTQHIVPRKKSERRLGAWYTDRLQKQESRLRCTLSECKDRVLCAPSCTIQDALQVALTFLLRARVLVGAWFASVWIDAPAVNVTRHDHVRVFPGLWCYNYFTERAMQRFLDNLVPV